MGKSPRVASAGVVFAMLMSAGCQSTPNTLPTNATMQQQAMQRNPQGWNGQNANGAGGSVAQGNTNGLTNTQTAGNQANPRPQNGQSFAASGNFQNNFTNSAQPGGGLNQNTSSGGLQQTGFNSNAGGVQQAGYNPAQPGGGVQQAGGWPSKEQMQQAGAGTSRNTISRNTDDVYSGGAISSSMPAPSFPGGGAGNANSQDPPPVRQSNTGSSNQPLPFNSSTTTRSGGY
ncbi:hypothetical protein BH10PLA2_BH10PLA2_14900 [soil metagenome]